MYLSSFSLSCPWLLWRSLAVYLCMEPDALVMQNEKKAENGFPLELKNRFQELVKFTLHSHLNDTLGFHHLGLSTKFCSTLLKDDPTDPYSDDTGNFSFLTVLPKFVCFVHRETRQKCQIAFESNLRGTLISIWKLLVLLLCILVFSWKCVWLSSNRLKRWLWVDFFYRPFKPTSP